MFLFLHFPEAFLSENITGRRMSGGDYYLNSKTVFFHGSKNGFSAKYGAYKGNYHGGKRNIWLRKHLKSIALTFVFMGLLFLLDSLMVSIFDSANIRSSLAPINSSGIKEENKDAKEGKEKSPVHMYDRLLNLASSALVEKEFKPESANFWEEPFQQASAWKPCADRKLPTSLERYNSKNGYILVSANGGLNQQRVAGDQDIATACRFAMPLPWHHF